MVSEKKIISEISEKLVRAGLYTAKRERVDEIASKLGLKLKKITDRDLKKVRKILSKGEPLSKIVIETRGA